MKIRWTEKAQRDLEEIFTYIAEDRPAAARSLVGKIRSAVADLAGLPSSGRIIPEIGDRSLRERLVRPYRIFYLVRGEEVVILGVHHSRRELPEELSRVGK